MKHWDFLSSLKNTSFSGVVCVSHIFSHMHTVILSVFSVFAGSARKHWDIADYVMSDCFFLLADNYCFSWCNNDIITDIIGHCFSGCWPTFLFCKCSRRCLFQPVNFVIIIKVKSLQATIRKHSQLALIRCIFSTVRHLHLTERTWPHLCRFAAQRSLPVQKQRPTWNVKTRFPNCSVSCKWLVDHCCQLPRITPCLVCAS